MKIKNFSLRIGWLYPDLMSTYGDRGNIIVLQKRCSWRSIQAEIIKVSLGSNIKDLESVNLIFMGGAQDIQQEIVNKDLFSGKGEIITQMIRNYIPALFICGAYQFMGKFYKTADGKKLLGLGLFDLYTENPGLNKKRLIGNIVISNIKHLSSKIKIVGFENHGGRTYLANKSLALARVFKGYGNNGEDKTEGMVYKNAIGTYLHGPLFSKNPEIADWLIQKALEIKYKRKFKLQKLNDNLEYKAREKIIMKTV